jgi:hypothetical protein
MSPVTQSSGSGDPAQEPDPTQPQATSAEPAPAAGPLADLVADDAALSSGSPISDPVREVFAELAADMPPDAAYHVPGPGP